MPHQDSELSHFLYFSVHSICVCVCACFDSSFRLYYISSDELILFFPKGYELFFLCYNSACEKLEQTRGCHT